MDAIPIVNPNSDTPSEDALSIVKPDYSKRYANLHYANEFGEYGTIIIRENTSLDDVFRQYVLYFPRESKVFMEQIRQDNEQLLNSSGMSNNRTIMSLGKVPEIIMTACKFLYGEDFWEKRSNSISFFRSNPKLMVGNHSKKKTGNTIIH